MNLFFHENLMLPKGTFLAVLVTQIPVCFNKKNSLQATNSKMMQKM